MITTAAEYYANLYRIQDENPPTLALLLPSTEKIYNIDLNTRTIEAPEFLSVETDHRAEAIYFKMPRFFDGIDLTTKTAVIQYENAAGEGHVYVVPFYDIETADRLGINLGTNVRQTVLFPWLIDHNVAKVAGTVKYNIRFYELASESQVLYSLNTLPSESKILHGIDLSDDTLYSVVTLTENNYEPNSYYIKNEQGEFIIDERNEFHAGETYYILNDIDNDSHAASFLEQMMDLGRQAAERDIYWIDL
jgi:hypothetical protein